MEKIYGMHKLVGLQLFWSGTPTFSSGTPTFCQMGVLNSCFQNPSESSACVINTAQLLYNICHYNMITKFLIVEHIGSVGRALDWRLKGC